MSIARVFWGTLLGLPFVAMGVVLALDSVVPVFQSWQEMRDWQPTRAVLVNVSGPSGPENRVKAHYRYQVAGIEYQGNRLSVVGVNEVTELFYQDFYGHLRWLKDHDEPVGIWVDPNNPTRSVIDRDMHWDWFAQITGLCGVLILIGLAACWVISRGTFAAEDGFNY